MSDTSAEKILINPPKRPVAKHACLACREKKIKCDGEITTQQEDGKPTEVIHQRCSNCKLLNVECVFVRSLRGGRRKKPQDGSGASTPNTSTSQQHPRVQNGVLLQSPRSAAAQNNGSQLDSPANIVSNHTTVSPSLAGSIHQRTLSGSSYLQEKVRALQKEAADIQSQLSNQAYEGSPSHMNNYPPQYTNNRPPLISYSASAPSIHHAPYDPVPLHIHPQHQHQPPFAGPPPPHPHHPQGVPPVGFLPQKEWEHGGPPPPHVVPHHLPPPSELAPGASSNNLESHPPPSYHDPHAQVYRSEHPPYAGQDLPPIRYATEYEPNNNHHASGLYSSRESPGSEASRKRTFSAREVPIFTPGTSVSSTVSYNNYISVSDQELEMFDLPDWKSTCILIDLYYRYIHPSRPFLQPKHRLISHFNIRKDASLLHAMFSSSCCFASSKLIANQNLRDPQHWYFLAEKYWDLLDLETSLQAMVLLSGSLGPSGYVQQAIEGSERLMQILRVNNVLNTLAIGKEYETFARIASKRQLLVREDLIRTVWGSWKLNVFLRINRGAPFNRISGDMLTFQPDLQFPASDTAYNQNLSLFDTSDNILPHKLKYKIWKDFEADLELAKTTPSAYKNFHDSDLIIIAIKIFEDLMDTISQGNLSVNSVAEYNNKIRLVHDITTSSLYQISHIRKKILVLYVSKIFTILILAAAKIAINVTQCSPLLLIKPHETNSNSNPDDVFNSLYKLSVDEILSACLNTTASQVNHYMETFLAALNAVQMLELGEGKIPQMSNSIFPMQVVAGPLNFTPSNEINSLRSQENWWLDADEDPGKVASARVEYDSRYPDVWSQYPVFSVVVVANSLTILASSIVLTKFITIRENFSDPKPADGNRKIDFVVGTNQKIVTLEVLDAIYSLFMSNFEMNTLKEKIRLCSRYVKSQGRFWAYVELISNQMESIINYTEDVTTRL